MFTVTLNNVYLHDHGKIILFNNQNEINYFVQNFLHYSEQRMMQEGRIFEVANVMNAANNIKVEEWTDRMTCPCGTINYNDLKR